MANFFRNKVVNEIGTTPIQVLEFGPSTRGTIIGLSLTNLTGSNILATITVTDDASTVGHYIKDLLIAPGSSARVVNGGEKLILSTSNSLSISANVEDAVDAIISYVELI